MWWWRCQTFCSDAKARSNKHKLQKGKFQLSTREKRFNNTMKRWKKLPSEAVQSLSLEITWSTVGECDLNSEITLIHAIKWSEIGLDDIQTSFPPESAEIYNLMEWVINPLAAQCIQLAHIVPVVQAVQYVLVHFIHTEINWDFFFALFPE